MTSPDLEKLFDKLKSSMPSNITPNTPIFPYEGKTYSLNQMEREAEKGTSIGLVFITSAFDMSINEYI